MFVLITYDVATADKAGIRRLRRVAQACKDYGQRVQKSVFECKLEPQHWALLRNRLLKEINEKEDSLRFYFLDADGCGFFATTPTTLAHLQPSPVL